MEAYETEEQQVAAIKAWWKDNYQKVAVVAIVGIGSILGVQSYLKNVQLKKESASDHFNQVLSGAKDNQEDIIIGRTEILKNEHADSPYTVQASMLKAKVLVDKKDYQGAIKEFDWVASNTTDESLKQISYIRKIKLLMELGNNNEAMNEIKPLVNISDKSSTESIINSNPFMPVLNEIYGDLLVILNKKNEAKKAYDSALSGFIVSGVSTELLQIKRNDLGE
ncbi:MAG: tetratricopeptide repeat protein [Gammaproteobacteria bacterium]|nr:tetratricopeptide repeat protein [Gammaproteobacteria bacterium]